MGYGFFVDIMIMITPNTIQLVDGHLVIIGDPDHPNAISVKPTNDLATVWGTVNNMRYSFPANLLKFVTVFMKPNEKLWIDKRIQVPVERHDIEMLNTFTLPFNFDVQLIHEDNPLYGQLIWDTMPYPITTHRVIYMNDGTGMYLNEVIQQ